MRALIVYESMFGNTRDIAYAVAEGLTPHLDVDVVEIADAPEDPGDEVGLLVVGGPTHALGLSRPKTRADAVARTTTTPVVSRDAGLREWLDALPKTRRRRDAAAFDTRIRVRGLPGSAARGAAKRLRRRGYRLVWPTQSFYVTDTTGPLAEDELERARTWGHRLGLGMKEKESQR